MNWFVNLGINIRIYISISIVIVVVGAGYWSDMRDIKQVTNDAVVISERNLAGLSVIKDANLDLLQVERGLYAALREDSQDSRAKALDAVRRYDYAVTESLNKADGYFPGEHSKDSLRQLREEHAAYDRLLDKLDSTLRSETGVISRNTEMLVRVDLHSHLQPMTDALSALAKIQVDDARKTSDEASAIYRGTNLSGAVFGGAFAIALIFVMAIVRHTARGIDTLAALAKQASVGDFSQRMIEWRDDQIGLAGQALNHMIATVSGVADEIEALAEASRDGKLSCRANSDGFVGGWRHVLSGVNAVLDEAAAPINAQAAILQKMAEGNLSVRISEEFKGDHVRIKDAINRVADLAAHAIHELDVMTDASRNGDLKRRVKVDEFSGDWRLIMGGVNTLLDEAIGPINAQAAVLQRMAEGTLTSRITESFKGDHVRIKDAINRVADIASRAVLELDRLVQASRDGDLKRRAQADEFVGDWRVIMNGVNTVLDESIGPVNAQAAVLQKMAEGTLTARITDDFKGDHSRIKDAINRVADIAAGAMVELDQMIDASREGDLKRRAQVERYVGDWRIIMNGVNTVLDEAMGPVNAQVTVLQKMAEGTLTARITEEFRGDHARIKNAVNRVADIAIRAVQELDGMVQASRDGDLKRRAAANEFVGDWRIIMNGVNTILDEAIGPVNAQAAVLQKMAEGTLTSRITESFKGDHVRIKDAINRVADISTRAIQELDRMVQASRDGDLKRRAAVNEFVGDWRIIMNGFNAVLDEAMGPVDAQAIVLQKMAEGTLTARITDDFKGDHTRIKDAVNRVADIATRAVQELDRMVQASRDGDLGRRAKADEYVGDWRIIMNGINTVLDESIGPVNAQAMVLQKMAAGTLTARITDDFKGDHTRIKDAINRVADIAQGAMDEIDVMIQASREGDLQLRTQADRYVGDWRIIMNGVNIVLDEALGPINAQAAALQRMAEGTLTSRITEEFKGDHTRVKDAINRVAEIADGALSEFDQLITAFGEENYQKRADIHSYDGDWLKIMGGVNTILDSVQQTTDEVQRQNWIKSGLSELSDVMRGDLDTAELCLQVIRYLSSYTNAQIGAFFVYDSLDETLRLMGSFAYELRKDLSGRFRLGEGLVGQAALEKQLISITDLPDDYVHIHSGLGETRPRNSLVVPVVYEGTLKGVIELASLQYFSEEAIELLRLAAESVAVALLTAESASQTRELLMQTQDQARSLLVQQEELQQTNEELEEQTQQLQASEEQLRSQQEELRQTNDELEERSQLLEQQRNEIEDKNKDLESARADIAQRANDLAIASKYKSEFLANMSHELRTPLNSLLLLSRVLSDNKGGNLTDKQVEAANVIYNSGNDLLTIINDILDLSKVEAGRVDVQMGDVLPKEIADSMNALYRHVGEEKGVEFIIVLDDDIPEVFTGDRHRLGQILRNLLSNAFKFTHHGHVKLRVSRPAADVNLSRSGLDPAQSIVFSVQDTGIGIPKEKQAAVWEAFQQADGSTSREYGGTGLGLTITRELVHLLGGEVQLSSETGQGSTFTLFLPCDGVVTGNDDRAEASVATEGPLAQPTKQAIPKSSKKGGRSRKETSIADTLSSERIIDDSASLADNEKYILIAENDPQFAKILGDLCRKMNIKFVVTVSADEALERAKLHAPVAVLLDMHLDQETDGWAVLGHFKSSFDTLHIPVHVISSDERDGALLRQGAVGVLSKPVTQEQLNQVGDLLTRTIGKTVKDILVVEDDPGLRVAISQLLTADDVKILSVSSGAQGLVELQSGKYDLVILDLGLPDMSGQQMLSQLETMDAELGVAPPPVIIYTGRDLTRDEHEQLQRYSDSIIIKGVRSEERLVADASVFLHRMAAHIPEAQRKMMLSLHDRDAMFNDRCVLLVDDDIRNIYALSGVLEDRGLNVLTARNGQEALKVLDEHSEINLVLMDIMMPIMDGFEAMQRIRAQNKFHSLPIIALTAKAMKEDREKCMQFGASDYLTKPINIDRLLSIMRVWLYQ